MKKLFMILPLVLVLCFTFSCQQGEDVREWVEADVEADVEAIKGLLDEFDLAANASDADGLTELYTGNAVRIPPNEPALLGKEAIRAHFQEFYDQFTEEAENIVVDVYVSGDLAFSRGTWTSVKTPREGGESFKLNGNWVSIQRKQPNGSWKIACDIFSDESLVSPLTEKDN
jgi:uncharacterized protein (TIGR02246 family)